MSDMPNNSGPSKEKPPNNAEPAENSATDQQPTLPKCNCAASNRSDVTAFVFAPGKNGLGLRRVRHDGQKHREWLDFELLFGQMQSIWISS